MKRILPRWLFIASCSLYLVMNPGTARALTYDLMPPSGPITRGSNVTFSLNIDTEGSTVTTTRIGIEYDTQYLTYVSTAPGAVMDSVSVSDVSSGKMLLTGTASSGFSGTGVFAQITFKLIADAPGETGICSLYAPPEEPTEPPENPTTPPNNPTTVPTTPPGQPTATRTPTSPPLQGTGITVPTALPRTGSADNRWSGGMAIVMLAGATVFLFFYGDFGFAGRPKHRTQHRHLSKKHRHP